MAAARYLMRQPNSIAVQGMDPANLPLDRKPETDPLDRIQFYMTYIV